MYVINTKLKNINKKTQEVDIDTWNYNDDTSSVRRKTPEEVERGIDLILDKKDELISFKEPISFIFILQRKTVDTSKLGESKKKIYEAVEKNKKSVYFYNINKRLRKHIYKIF